VFLLDAPITGRRQIARGTFVIGMHATKIAARTACGGNSSTSDGSPGRLIAPADLRC
jgi:hypothetical protein